MYYRIYSGGYHTVSKVKLPLLVVSLGQACTLKCRDCANFSPYAEREDLFYPCEDILSDLKKILNVCKYIDVLQVQGGEPFIYPELDRILQFLLKEEKVKNIHIATNGTIVPKKLVHLLQNKKILVRISNYKVVGNSQIIDLCEELDRNNIIYKKYGFTKNDDKWIDCGNPDVHRESDDAIAAGRFEKCLFNHCLTLENGYIGKCSRCIHAAKVQNFMPRKGDYVFLRESRNLRREIQRYKDKCVPQNRFFMEACRFCYGTYYGKKVEPAIQIERRNEQ